MLAAGLLIQSGREDLAQKLDATGALLWGAGHVAVFDGGSLQFGNFPDFVTDGAGFGIWNPTLIGLVVSAVAFVSVHIVRSRAHVPTG